MILVTGGTGFIGRRVIARLAGGGHSLRVLTRGSGAQTALPGGVEQVIGDLQDAGTVRRALEDVDVVVHLAGRVAPASERELYAANVVATRTLAEAAREAEIRRFIHVSSAGAYGLAEREVPLDESQMLAPCTAYERSKAEAESVISAAFDSAGTAVIVLRPAGIYGPGRPSTSALFERVRSSRLLFHGPVRVTVHPTHVEDVARAVEQALAVPVAERLAVCNIAGARAVTFPELLALIGRALGRSPVQLQLPPSWAKVVGGAARGLRAAGVQHEGVVRAACGFSYRALDTRRMREWLGVEPVPLEQGLDEVARWLRAAGRA